MPPTISLSPAEIEEMRLTAVQIFMREDLDRVKREAMNGEFRRRERARAYQMELYWPTK